MEVGEEGDYIYLSYTVTIRMIPALRWTTMRAILMFHNCEGQSHKTVSTDHNFRRQRRPEADSNLNPSVYQPIALPLGQTGLLNGWANGVLACNIHSCAKAFLFTVDNSVSLSNTRTIQFTSLVQCNKTNVMRTGAPVPNKSYGFCGR